MSIFVGGFIIRDLLHALTFYLQRRVIADLDGQQRSPLSSDVVRTISEAVLMGFVAWALIWA